MAIPHRSFLVSSCAGQLRPVIQTGLKTKSPPLLSVARVFLIRLSMKHWAPRTSSDTSSFPSARSFEPTQTSTFSVPHPLANLSIGLVQTKLSFSVPGAVLIFALSVARAATTVDHARHDLPNQGIIPCLDIDNPNYPSDIAIRLFFDSLSADLLYMTLLYIPDPRVHTNFKDFCLFCLLLSLGRRDATRSVT